MVSMTPAGCEGSERYLRTATSSRRSSSKAVTSVNVPPTSMPTRKFIGESFSGAAARWPGNRWRDRNRARRRSPPALRQEKRSHVRRPPAPDERRAHIAAAAPTGELHAEEIAALEQKAGDLRGERAFRCAAGLQHRLRGARGLGAEHAGGGELEAIHAQVHRRLLGQNAPLTAHAEAATKFSRAARVAGKLVALDADAKLRFDGLAGGIHHVDDQLVHRAHAVAVGTRARAAVQDLVL